MVSVEPVEVPTGWATSVAYSGCISSTSLIEYLLSDDVRKQLAARVGTHEAQLPCQCAPCGASCACVKSLEAKCSATCNCGGCEPPLELTAASVRALQTLKNIGARHAPLIFAAFAHAAATNPLATVILSVAKQRVDKATWSTLWRADQRPLSVAGKRLGQELVADGHAFRDISAASASTGGGAGGGAGASAR